MAEKTWINIGGVNKEAIPWINVNGTWKQCIPWVNVNGVWKKCYSDDGTQTMTIYIPASGDSASQSQNRIVTIPNLQNVISCIVNTGVVSYNVNGTSVTIYVNNGNYVRTYIPTPASKVVSDFRATTLGGDPATLPSSIPYNSGGYSGTLYGGTAYLLSGDPPDSKVVQVTDTSATPLTLPDYRDLDPNFEGYTGILYATGPAYVYSGSPAGSKYCTGTWGTTYTIVNGNIIGGASAPATIPYSDGEYSGNIDFVNVNQAYLSAWMEFADAYDAGGSWSGYILFDYGKTLTKPYTQVWARDYVGTVYKPDTRVWRKDYSGTVYAQTTYYYAYIVTLSYKNT